jgi:hypothetical protein
MTADGSLDIDEFDLSRITIDTGVLIVGKTACGKSTLMYDIMSQLADQFDFGKAMTPTLSSRKRFESCMPRQFIEKQSIDGLQNYVDYVKQKYDDDDANGKTKKKAYIICDDTAFDEKFMNSTTLKELMMNGRQFGMFRMLVLQYLMTIKPGLRSNADFVFVFWDNNTANQKKIHANWFGMVPFPRFRELFSLATQNHGVIVIDVRKSAVSRDWHDCVSWYRARQEQSAFQMCKADFFKLGQRTMVNVDRKPEQASGSRVRLIDIDGNVVME